MDHVTDDELAHAIVDALDGRPLAAAESCTAGRVASTLASVEGAIEFLRGGLVAYQEPVKRQLLGVTASSVYSLAAAEQMARGACLLLGAGAAVATTGVVGDDPVDGVDPGTVFVGTCVDGTSRSAVHRFTGTPASICEGATRQALLDLLDAAQRASRP